MVHRGSSSGVNFYSQSPQVQHPVEANPILRKASEGSVGVLFLLLSWRSLSTYELADSFASKRMRLCSVLPTMFILVSNMAGFIINVMRPNNFKSMLKAILALNMIREAVEVCFNICKIVFKTDYTTTPKEVYFGRFFGNIWWISLCASFSKSRWVSSRQRRSYFYTHAQKDDDMDESRSHSFYNQHS